MSKSTYILKNKNEGTPILKMEDYKLLQKIATKNCYKKLLQKIATNNCYENLLQKISTKNCYKNCYKKTQQKKKQK